MVSTSSTSSSPTFESSSTSFSNTLSTFDVSTHGEGPFPKPLIREDSWNRIPLEYRPLTPQPGSRWRRSNHRDVPAEYRSGSASSSQSPRPEQFVEGESEGWSQRRDHRRGMLSTSSMNNNSSGDKTSWFTALLTTMKRPKHNRRETPPSISVSPDLSQPAISTPPLPPSPTPSNGPATFSAATVAPIAAPAAINATVTTTTTASSSYLAPPPSNTTFSYSDSVVWDPAAEVWRRLSPTSTPANGRNRSNSSPNTSAFSFPYSDYTLMTDSERLDYFLDHRVSSVVDDDDASFRASLGDDSESAGGDDEEVPPPPPYVQSQWEA
ncbi:hypothetical protein GP486_008650, partial [Trichoglossum hirsutum]